MTKFFGYEIGAQSKWDDHRRVGFVNGVHDTNDLQELVFKYIELLIMCPSESCQRPEIRYMKSGKNIRTCFFFFIFSVLCQPTQPFFVNWGQTFFFVKFCLSNKTVRPERTRILGEKFSKQRHSHFFFSLTLSLFFFL